MTRRTTWFASRLTIDNEPLVVSLWKYRLHHDRYPLHPSLGFPNLISSRTDDGRQMPVLDLDVPARLEPSSTEGHTHLYLDVPMSRWRWAALMVALRIAGVIETGFLVWSLRRGGNFVRVPGTYKKAEEHAKPDYGWFFKTRHHGE